MYHKYRTHLGSNVFWSHTTNNPALPAVNTSCTWFVLLVNTSLNPTASTTWPFNDPSLRCFNVPNTRSFFLITVANLAVPSSPPVW